VFAQLRIELHEPLALGGRRALARRLHRQQAGERIDARGDVGPAQFARQGRLEILRVENAGTINCTPEKSSTPSCCACS
jgi:hypothetical protein